MEMKTKDVESRERKQPENTPDSTWKYDADIGWFTLENFYFNRARTPIRSRSKYSYDHQLCIAIHN